MNQRRERTYGRDYSEVVDLADGTTVRIRWLDTEDKDKLRKGFRRLSMESRYRRFLAPKSTLTDAELDYLTDVDQYRHLALGVTLVEGESAGEGIAVARCIRLGEESRTAEIAVTIVDAYQGLGLGSMLVERISVAARERGIDTFRATLLAGNTPMRMLLSRLGPVEVVERDGSVMTVDVTIAEHASATEDAARQSNEHTRRSRTPLERIWSMTARGVASLFDKIRN
jgi:GNAT superfamily N-acetyltransferase